MSFLAPLYVLGALGIGLPILFHLIKRQPRGQRAFSSLMFLRPTPPTVTRRSRLDHLPLLLLRALALLLLAAAFARPYFRGPAQLIEAAPGKRIVLVIDTTASMQRAGLWDKTIKQADELINNLNAADHLAIVSFDSKPANRFAFEQSAALELVARQESARQSLRKLQPTWNGGNLSSALIFAADLLAVYEPNELTSKGNTARPIDPAGFIVVISDMQAGGEENLKALQAYSWPKDIKAEFIPIIVEQKTNATVMALDPRDDELNSGGPKTVQDEEDQAPSPITRIRVSNSMDATHSDFTVVWQVPNEASIESTRIPIHVGPGESRVIRMPEPPASLSDTSRMQLILQGDDHDFDNIRYIARPKPMEQELLLLANEATDPRNRLGYYLERAPLDNRSRNVRTIVLNSNDLPEEIESTKTPLVIAAQPIPDAMVSRLKQYIESGGRVLWVLDQETDIPATEASLRELSDEPELSISEAEANDYAMWSKIEFSHPLFAPLADPRFNDFSKIKFWSHRKVQGGSDRWRTLVRFDDGNDALIEKSMGEGKLWILAAGWQPRDSQLALSTKFVPLLNGFYSGRSYRDDSPSQYLLGNSLPFTPSATARIESADQATIAFQQQEDALALKSPGFYRFIEGETVQEFAANVPPSESSTQPLTDDELERYGVQLGSRDEPLAAQTLQRQQQDVEREGRQRLWRWILLTVLGLIAAESALSGYLRRRNAAAS